MYRSATVRSGDRRFRAGWRDVPGSGNPVWSSWIRGPIEDSEEAWQPVPDRQSGRRSGSAGSRHLQGHHDHRRYPTVFVESGGAGLSPAPTAGGHRCDTELCTVVEACAWTGGGDGARGSAPEGAPRGNIRRRSPLCRRRATTPHRAASRSRPAKSISRCTPSDGQTAPCGDGHGRGSDRHGAAIPGTLVERAHAGRADPLRPADGTSLRCRGGRRASGALGRRMESHQGDHEPQRPPADGRMGADSLAPWTQEAT